jgi:PTS system mannose-specific IIC component
MDLLAVDGDLLRLVAVALLGGWLTLDDTAWSQTWFSQPLPAGLLAGLVCGDPLTGLAIGLPLQLVLVGNIPVGQTFTGDPTAAVVGAVASAVLSGHNLRSALVTGEFGLPLLGWLILGAALLSLAGNLAVQAERRAHVPLMLQGHLTLRDGDLGRILRLHHRGLALTFVRGAVGAVLATLLLARVWVPLLAVLPERVHLASGILAVLLPGLGLGTVIERYGFVRGLPYFALGLAVALVTVRWGP